MGAIGASAELLDVFDQRRDDALYHGGSFNGNPIGCTAGRIAVEDLTAGADRDHGSPGGRARRGHRRGRP